MPSGEPEVRHALVRVAAALFGLDGSHVSKPPARRFLLLHGRQTRPLPTDRWSNSAPRRPHAPCRP
jgi:hypothetical protein